MTLSHPQIVANTEFRSQSKCLLKMSLTVYSVYYFVTYHFTIRLSFHFGAYFVFQVPTCKHPD